MIRVLLQNLAAIALYVWAVRRGGAPEKLLSRALVAALLVNLAVRLGLKVPTLFGQFDPASMAIDGILLALSIWIAVVSNRTWPLWFAALQLLAVVAHLLRLFDYQTVHPMSYSILARVPTYAQLVVLLIAMIACTRRSAKGIRASDWRR